MFIYKLKVDLNGHYVKGKIGEYYLANNKVSPSFFCNNENLNEDTLELVGEVTGLSGVSYKKVFYTRTLPLKELKILLQNSELRLSYKLNNMREFMNNMNISRLGELKGEK